MQVSVYVYDRDKYCIMPGKYDFISSVDCGLSGIDSGHVFRAALSSTSLREQIMGDSHR